MGRILRLFYDHQNCVFGFATLRKILTQYLNQLVKRVDEQAFAEMNGAYLK